MAEVRHLWTLDDATLTGEVAIASAGGGLPRRIEPGVDPVPAITNRSPILWIRGNEAGTAPLWTDQGSAGEDIQGYYGTAPTSTTAITPGPSSTAAMSFAHAGSVYGNTSVATELPEYGEGGFAISAWLKWAGYSGYGFCQPIITSLGAPDVNGVSDGWGLYLVAYSGYSRLVLSRTVDHSFFTSINFWSWNLGWFGYNEAKHIFVAAPDGWAIVSPVAYLNAVQLPSLVTNWWGNTYSSHMQGSTYTIGGHNWEGSNWWQDYACQAFHACLPEYFWGSMDEVAVFVDPNGIENPAAMANALYGAGGGGRARWSKTFSNAGVVNNINIPGALGRYFDGADTSTLATRTYYSLDGGQNRTEFIPGAADLDISVDSDETLTVDADISIVGPSLPPPWIASDIGGGPSLNTVQPDNSLSGYAVSPPPPRGYAVEG